jgi:hypothetical protein
VFEEPRLTQASGIAKSKRHAAAHHPSFSLGRAIVTDDIDVEMHPIVDEYVQALPPDVLKRTDLLYLRKAL